VTEAPDLQTPERSADGRTRILSGALTCLKVDSIAGFSLQRASIHAGVSKALLLYHFRTRDALLEALVEWLTHRVMARERNALDGSASTSVLDDLWAYLADEHERGEYFALLTLVGARLPALQSVSARSVEQRRSHSTRSLEGIHQRLQLTPRLPLAHITEAEQAFRDGLLLRMGQHVVATPRAAFDVFWLALLNQSA
jgi:AcrR family transcriptional regulator